jgi:uncharacterized protein with ParB-like and HNH nuclease domain
MSDKKIFGGDFKVSDIFSKKFDFFIPGYQRPYAWTDEEAGQLFDDLSGFFASAEGIREEPYFLGSIVLIKQEECAHSQVIDGQQRITTLTILLSVLASKLDIKNQESLFSYLCEPGNKFEKILPKPRLTLRDKDREFFFKYIQNMGKIEDLITLDEAKLSESQKNIKNNARCFVQRISDFSAEQSFKFASAIITQCYLVVVSTPTTTSAYRIFSVLNNRGLELLPTDIIKAEIIGNVPEKGDKDGTSRDDYTTKWENKEDTLGRTAFNELFTHIRSIYKKDKQQKTLMEEFKSHVLSVEKDPMVFIDNVLIPFADAFDLIKKAAYKSTENAADINNSIKWLLRIDNVDWMPSAILFTKLHAEESKLMANFFKSLERLTASLFIRRYNINDRIKYFGELTKAVETGQDLWAAGSPLQLTDQDKKDTIDVLSSDIYSMKKTRVYIMLRLDSWLSESAAEYDHEILSIEHVLPQTVEPGSEWDLKWPDSTRRAAWVNKLGNLILLSRYINSSAQNYDFKKKKGKYFTSKEGVSSFAITTGVLAESEWTEAIISKRQTDLIAKLKEGWELE